MYPETSQPVRDCYHIYSDGTRHPVLFESRRDKIYAKNLLAILAFHYHVALYAIVIMETHFHVVVRDPREKAGKYIGEIKRLLSKYFHKSGRADLLGKGLDIAWDPIMDEEELMRKIIYVFRNGIDAGFPLLPECYPWGAGRAYFQRENMENYHKVSDLGVREKARIFHTRVDIPGEWYYDDEHMLLASSYLDTRFVEKALFRSQKRFLAFLHVRKKDLTDLDWECSRKFIEEGSEQTLRSRAAALAGQLFKAPVSRLSQADKLFLAKEMWKSRETLSRRQLARAVHLEPALLEGILH